MLKCIVCGKEFLQIRENHYHCSQDCVKKAYRERTKELRNSTKKERYANDPEFREKVQSAIRKKRQEDRRAKDIQRFGGNRELILIRDGYACTSCGLKENLHVHHKDRSGSDKNPNNDPHNLITLCISCHSLEHTGDNIKGIDIPCRFCGKIIYAKPHELLRGVKRYCSRECTDKDNVGSLRTSKKRNCEVCNTEFIAQQNQMALGKGKYCSQKCSSQSQSKKLKVNCTMCNTEFETIPAKLRVGKGKFCSKPCYFKHKAL